MNWSYCSLVLPYRDETGGSVEVSIMSIVTYALEILQSFLTPLVYGIIIIYDIQYHYVISYNIIES